MSSQFCVVVRVLPAALNGSLKWSLYHQGKVYGPGQLVELPYKHAAELQAWGSVYIEGPEVSREYHKANPVETP